MSVVDPTMSGPVAKMFLGQEFLTWIYFEILEKSGELTVDLLLPGEKEVRPVDIMLTVGARTTLRTLDKSGAAVTLRGGFLDDSSELLAAIRNGALIESLELDIEVSARPYRFTLRGLDGAVSSVRFPDLFDDGDEEPEDFAPPQEKRASKRQVSFDEIVSLRLDCLDDVDSLVDSLFTQFVTKRLSTAWESSELSTIRTTVSDRLKTAIAR